MSAAVEKKKVFGLPYNVGVGLLCVLGAICLYEFYDNVLAGPAVPSQPARSTAQSPAAPAIPVADSEATATPRHQSASQKRTDEFNPPLHSKRPEDRPDPNKIDPTLRLDLLAKVQGVDLAGGARNLFQMGAPPPKVAELTGPPPIVRPVIGPRPPPPPVQPPKEVTQAAPVMPIQLKFYGFSTIRGNGAKTAYFLDGEDILLGVEGQVLKKKYRIKSIQATSVLMEDIEAKRTESIPLTPPDSQS